MLAVVARFELRYHRREFLTWVYVAVFLALTTGFTANGVIELVSDRGAVPRTSPWSLAHAMAGVTAFGQVITTMIAATTVLRDVSLRTRELFFTTRLSRLDYLGGRFVGSLAVMLLVYLAIPAGLALGAAVGGDAASLDAERLLRPWAMLVVPNVVVVASLFFAAGALSGSFMSILLLGVGLVALWQTGLALAAQEPTRWLGVLLDPFGSAALSTATDAWGEAERATRQIPAAAEIVANRALWLAIAAGAAAGTVRLFRFDVAGSATVNAASDEGRGARGELPPLSRPSPLAPRPSLSWLQQATTEGRFVFLRTVREKGFAALALLAVLNASANAWRARDGGAAAVLDAVELHARLFFILVATIWAGELVWRERDVRAHELTCALPVRAGAMAAGKSAGIAAAELVLVLALVAIALAVQAAGGALDLANTAARMLGGLWPAAVSLTLVSLAVHAAVRNKVLGHLLLIAAWVIAVAVGLHDPSAPRFPDPIAWVVRRVVPGVATSPAGTALAVCAGWALLVAAASRIGGIRRGRW